jgi:cobalt-precorrin 5A hydrolase/precorrin-3B C17-methyltransferase
MIGLIAVTRGGRRAAARLAAAWPGETRLYDGPVRQVLPRAWAQCDALVCFHAVGATVRLIAPLLDSKWTDPAVVCVDESCRHAVAVVGGHAAGANALAARVAEVFGADAVITTSTDAVSLPGLGDLDWPTEGAIGPVSRALLDGERVRLESARTWPLPPLPETVGAVGDYRIVITDEVLPADARTAVLRPPSLVIGVDASRGAAAEDVLALADGALAAARLSAACVAAVATADSQAAEPGLRDVSRHRGWPLVGYPADRLGSEPAPRARGARGGGAAAGLAEAAAVAGAAELVVPAIRTGGVAVAVARVWPRGRLALVGTGPGARDLLTPRAIRELRRASVVAGLGRSLDQVGDLLRAGTRTLAGGPGQEEVCARAAVREARQGHAVAIAIPADADPRPVAQLILDLAREDIDVIEVPGVTGDLTASAFPDSLLGIIAR